MIHRLIGLVVVLAVIIIGLTMYLAPDDQANVLVLALVSVRRLMLLWRFLVAIF